GRHQLVRRRIAHLERRSGLDELGGKVDRDAGGANLGGHGRILLSVAHTSATGSWMARSLRLSEVRRLDYCVAVNPQGEDDDLNRRGRCASENDRRWDPQGRRPW